MTEYQVALRAPVGTLSEALNDFTRLTYSLVESGVGLLEITLPPTHDAALFNGDDVIVDQQITVSRRVGSQPFQVDGEAGWLVRYGQQQYGQDRQRLTVLQAVHANDLLRRRIVAYAAGSSEAAYAALPADDAMKQIVEENLGATAGGDRDISAYLSIQPDLSQGASIAKAFSRRNVLSVLQEYTQASAQAGSYLAFDTVALPAAGQFQFRTYLGQRGSDHRLSAGARALEVGPQFGNLLNAAISFDHKAEVTSVYAGGQGEEAARVIGTATDAARIAASPFNYIEQFVDARYTDAQATLDDEAEYALHAGIYQVLVTGVLQDTYGFVYGLDYGWGDYLTLQVGGFSADCRLSAVVVTLERGAEGVQQTVQAVLKGEVT